MGRLNKVLGVRGGRARLLRTDGRSAGLPCPECGQILVPDEPGSSRYECFSVTCSGVYFEEGGALYTPEDLRLMRLKDDGRFCLSCQAPLRGDLTSPWEDGDNPHAYVTCRCGFKNPIYGFGEDDG
jgi:RNase P subunit RPR2